MNDKTTYNKELYEQNRKNKIKHTKEVYSVCACFHEELQILAISLIDKDIKIYKIKQNGTKLSIYEAYSFIAKFLVSCMHIEQYSVNGRVILCLGGQ